MKLFRNNKKRLEMIKAIRPTSKASLKMQCIFATKGNIDEANKLYDYFAKDMPELPDYDPVPQTWVDNTKDAVNGLMSWVKDNQDTLSQAYEFIRGIVQNKTLPPIGIEEAASGAPLPDINE
jgi:hypothetical protein